MTSPAVADGTPSAHPVDPRLRFEPAEPARHGALVHAWMHEPHVAPWWAMAWPRVEIERYLARQGALAHLRPWVVHDEADRPFAYVETYVTADDPLADHYPARPGDRGWHVLVGPPQVPGTELTTRLGHTVLGRLLAEPGADRVVCEPDVRNLRMIRWCHKLGHRTIAVLDLPDKRAALLATPLPAHRAGSDQAGAAAPAPAAGAPGASATGTSATGASAAPVRAADASEPR